MKKYSRFVAAAAAALMLAGSVASFAASAPATPAKPQVSTATAKDLLAAQKAQSDKMYDEELVILDKVKANPKKTDYDEFVMDEFYFSAYVGLKRYPEAAPPLDAAMASKFMGPDEMKQRLAQASVLYYQLQNYEKAAEFGTRAMDAGYSTPQLQLVVVQSYYLKNDYKNTDRAARSVVDDQLKNGQPPAADMLRLGLSAAAKLNDEPGEVHWLELIAAYHPTPEDWESLLDTMYRNKLSDRQTLQLYRLSTDVGSLKRGADIGEMAQLELDAGSPGEAVATLNKGFEANAFTDAADKTRNQHLLETAKKQAAADQPTLAKMEAEAGSSPSGDRLIGAGIGYFSYGDYAKAITDISAGLAKGTSKDSSDARLLLGIAQLRTGDKDSAVKTFQSVQGDAVYQRLAALWILRAKSP